MGDIMNSIMSDPAARKDDEKSADELLAIRLLAGCQFEGDGLVTTSYLKHNSHEERQARAALARMVRASMRGFSGELLALAIDPRTPSKIPGMRPTRKIKFESPTRGNSAKWGRDLMVVDFIKAQLRESRSPPKFEAAIVAAMEHYQISRRQVRDIWKSAPLGEGWPGR